MYTINTFNILVYIRIRILDTFLCVCFEVKPLPLLSYSEIQNEIGTLKKQKPNVRQYSIKNGK